LPPPPLLFSFSPFPLRLATTLPFSFLHDLPPHRLIRVFLGAFWSIWGGLCTRVFTTPVLRMQTRCLTATYTSLFVLDRPATYFPLSSMLACHSFAMLSTQKK
jgi:hypothetical protein